MHITLSIEDVQNLERIGAQVRKLSQTFVVSALERLPTGSMYVKTRFRVRPVSIIRYVQKYVRWWSFERRSISQRLCPRRVTILSLQKKRRPDNIGIGN